MGLFKKIFNTSTSRSRIPNIFLECGAEDLWQSFSEEEKAEIDNKYRDICGTSVFNATSIHSKSYFRNNRSVPFTPFYELSLICSWFKTHKYHALQEKMVAFISKNHLDSSADYLSLHFWYNTLIDFYYRPRDAAQHNEARAIEICELDINLLKKHTKYFIKEFGGVHARYPAIKTLAIIYEKAGEYDKAIKICETALFFNQDDGTKHGFDGRMARLSLKINKK